MDIYSKIKNRRLLLGMSQDDLAYKLGYKDRSSIAKIESGKVDISISKVSEFARVLKTTPEYLMGWDEESDHLNSINDIDFSGINRIAANYQGEEFSEESLIAIQDFIEYVRQKDQKKNK